MVFRSGAVRKEERPLGGGGEWLSTWVGHKGLCDAVKAGVVDLGVVEEEGGQNEGPHRWGNG